MIKLPKDGNTLRRVSREKYFSGIDVYHLDQCLKELRSDRNMHVKCPWDSKVNYRRGKTINKFKRAACLDDYRDIYSTDRDLLYIYTLKTGILFAPSYQLTILNLFLLKHINHLKMTNEDGNELINKLLKSVTKSTAEEDEIREFMPNDLNDRACMAKFQSLLALPRTDYEEYEKSMRIRLAIMNTKDRQKLLKDCTLVKENLETVIFSPLAIILDNKYDVPKKALRLVKEYCM